MIKTSASDILLYETCPRKWALTKGGFKTNKQSFAFYRFGSALHYAINKWLFEMEDITEVFDDYWVRHKDSLVYVKEDCPQPTTTWIWLSLLGHIMLNQFKKEFPEKNITPLFGEKRLRLATPEWEFVGQPDFVGYRDSVSRYLVMDFKTTEEKIDDFWVRMSDQMTGMAMLVMNEFSITPPIDILICNLVKSDEKIFWINDVRTKEDIDAYISKINQKIADMYVNKYQSRRSLYSFSSPCSWCEFKGDTCRGTEVKKATGLNEMLKAVEV